MLQLISVYPALDDTIALMDAGRFAFDVIGTAANGPRCLLDGAPAPVLLRG